MNRLDSRFFEEIIQLFALIFMNCWMYYWFCNWLFKFFKHFKSMKLYKNRFDASFKNEIKLRKRKYHYSRINFTVSNLCFRIWTPSSIFDIAFLIFSVSSFTHGRAFLFSVRLQKRLGPKFEDRSKKPDVVQREDQSLKGPPTNST